MTWENLMVTSETSAWLANISAVSARCANASRLAAPSSLSATSLTFSATSPPLQMTGIGGDNRRQHCSCTSLPVMDDRSSPSASQSWIAKFGLGRGAAFRQRCIWNWLRTTRSRANRSVREGRRRCPAEPMGQVLVTSRSPDFAPPERPCHHAVISIGCSQ